MTILESAAARITPEDLLAIPDNNSMELVDGHLQPLDASIASFRALPQFNHFAASNAGGADSKIFISLSVPEGGVIDESFWDAVFKFRVLAVREKFELVGFDVIERGGIDCGILMHFERKTDLELVHSASAEILSLRPPAGRDR